MNKPPPDAREVYFWPEFKALCERLGVDHGASTTRIEIILDINDVAKVVHSYNGKDCQDLTAEQATKDLFKKHEEFVRLHWQLGDVP